MVYYKFVNTETRDQDELNECHNNNCPEFRMSVTSTDLSGADCRGRLYTSEQLTQVPVC